MARKRAKKSPKAKASRKHLIVWVRLPAGSSVTAKGPRSPQLTAFLKKAGLNPSARCYGGDTCIA